MPGKFDYFVILAGMRTGSNYLEDSLNRFEAIQSYGEVFNPQFVGHARNASLFGRSPADIADDPVGMIDLLKKESPGLPGFRLFADHSPQVLAHVLADPACAKIILSRNPVESFVSLLIAKDTDQWKLGDARNRKSAQIAYDGAEFRSYLADLRGHYAEARRETRLHGQSAFEIGYEELGDDGILAGLARFLGVDSGKRAGAVKTRKQNPEPLSAKVLNFPEMVADLSAMDPLELFSEPTFEPPRGANLTRFLVAETPALIYMPIKAGPEMAVSDWLGALDGGTPPQSGFLQKDLRQWKRRHKGHRSFTVIRHPVQRAFSAYVRHIVEPGPEHFAAIRDTLATRYKINLPPAGPAANLSESSLRQGFLGFLDFLKANLAGQSAVRIDPAWASQCAIIAGMAEFMLPDHILREDRLEIDLAFLCAGAEAQMPEYRPNPELPALLAGIYDDRIEKAARAAYQRDYMMFGFGRWRDA